jgi:hypothetical protein
LRIASLDSQSIIPQQIWYDQLRSSDDGSFTKVSITDKANGRDPVDYIHQHNNTSSVKLDKIKSKLLNRWSKITKTEDQNHKSDIQNDISQQLRPFNSTSRNQFKQIRGGIFSTSVQIQKSDQVGNL